MGRIREESGWTMVEVMMVVLTIGLLAAIGVPNFVQARAQSRINTCVNNLRLIQAAKDQYALENNQPEAMTPGASDISPYFRAVPLTGGMPKEPQSGAYTIHAVNEVPTCDQANHTL